MKFSAQFSSLGTIFGMAAILLLLGLGGCASSRGFNRGQLRESLEHATVIDDEDIQKTLALKPQLPKPFKLGVYFVDPATPANSGGASPSRIWRWNEMNRGKILDLVEPLKAMGEVSEVFPITSAVANSGSDLRSLRLAAAKEGADAILIISGVSDTDAYANSWSWTYALLLPMLFVPASQTDVLFIARATMWDVRNQFLYLSAEAESLNQRNSPLAFIKERDQIETAKNDAMARLSDELKKMVDGIQHSPDIIKKTKEAKNTPSAPAVGAESKQ